MASRNGHLDAVEWLLHKQADVEAEGPNGETPLHAAARSGHHDVVALLIDRGANIQARDEARAMTALHTACIFGRSETVRLLLDRGCDIEDRDKAWSETPLIAASSSGALDVVRLLLQRGAQINAVDGKGRTALMKAAAFDKVDTVRALVAAGADVRHKDEEDQYTALHYLCCTEERYEEGVRIAELLLERGAKTNEPDSDGLTPPDCAVSYGHEDLAALFVKKAGVELTQYQLDKALLHCASEGNFHEKVAQMLIKAGASLNCRDSEGNTPLIHAAERADVMAVRFFASSGADTRARNAKGDTALDIALRGRHHDIVEFLRSRTQK
jgi:ankyrin repeat protein